MVPSGLASASQGKSSYGGGFALASARDGNPKPTYLMEKGGL